MYVVDLGLVKKFLRKIPYPICHKVQIWADMVEKEGLPSVQKVRGFKDHALRGKRKGQRTVYLNRKWRLIYTTHKKNQFVTITVKEVIPHDY